MKKIIEQNSWLEDQEKDLNKEITKKRKKIKNEDNQIMKSFLLILGAIFLIFNLDELTAQTYINCPSCKKGIKMSWGETWICPNKHCGYENYDQVSYCGVCGTNRYS